MGALSKLAVLLFTLYSTVSTGADYLVVPSDRIVEKLFVREAPQGARIANLVHGQSAKFLDRGPFWYRVELNDGTIGYVAKGYSKLIPVAKNRPKLEITYLRNGSGTCAVINCPGTNKSILMDCGSWPGKSDTNFHRSKQEIKSRIATLVGNSDVSAIFSHGDIDHYNYVPEVFSDVALKEIWLGGLSDFYTLEGMDKWLLSQEDKGANIRKDLSINYHSPDSQPEEGLSCGEADIFILSNRTRANNVPSKRYRNRNSMTALLEYDDFRAVFTGDAEKATEEQILKNFPNLTATVVTASHHGASSHGSNYQYWIDRIKPKIVVYTSGFKYEHPRCEVTGRFTSHLADVPAHPFTCNATAEKPFVTSSKAEYGTEAVGDVTIISDGVSPVRLECSDYNCTATISN